MKRLIIFIAVLAFIAVPSTSFAGNTWKKIKNHFKNCEVKVQGLTTEQWAAFVNPKKTDLNANTGGAVSMTATQKTLLVIGAVAVVGGLYAIYDNTKNIDPFPQGVSQGGD